MIRTQALVATMRIVTLAMEGVSKLSFLVHPIQSYDDFHDEQDDYDMMGDDF